jgi:hypothetical protein
MIDPVHESRAGLTFGGLNEGHGFSRTVKSNSYEGFRACVRTALAKSSPVGTAENQSCTGSPWTVCNRWSQRESGWPWMIANCIHVWSSPPRIASWVILSRPFGTDCDKLRELICFQRLRYQSGAPKRANWDKIDSQPSRRDLIGEGCSHAGTNEALALPTLLPPHKCGGSHHQFDKSHPVDKSHPAHTTASRNWRAVTIFVLTHAAGKSLALPVTR